MEVPDEFIQTPEEEIQSTLARIELDLMDISRIANDIYYKSDEEQEKKLNKLEKSLDILSSQINSIKYENEKVIETRFEMIRNKLDMMEYGLVKSHNYLGERIEHNHRSMSGRFIFIFRNFILLSIFVLLFYIAAK